ncbi:MAG: SpoIIE family protein phosphatase, partial [Clostridia bacterium]|nr:SpoIIE family protein phosphatase [Clostridia bacterium]
PTTCSCEISDGDVIVMVSDGVTDAFGSTGDFIDFLKGAPLYNPQELSDTILSRALTLSGNTADDDMSALCVRFFKSA